MAWIDLDDQLEQPERKIELPPLPEPEVEEVEAPEPAVGVPVVAEPEPALVEEKSVPEDEMTESEDEADDPPDPSSPLYMAKINYWTKKMAKAEAKGRSHKVEHYRRLLVMYPPVPNGHKILEAYLAALKAEYTDGQAGIVKMWIDASAEQVERVQGDWT